MIIFPSFRLLRVARLINTFVTSIKGTLSNLNLVTEPADVPNKPGVEMPEITFNATLFARIETLRWRLGVLSSDRNNVIAVKAIEISSTAEAIRTN